MVLLIFRGFKGFVVGWYGGLLGFTGFYWVLHGFNQ